MQFVIIPILLLLMFFLVIRPQQQRVREQHAVVASLEVGDEVMSSAGMIGRITSLSSDIATLEVAPGVEIRMARGAIARKIPADPATTDGGPIPAPETIDTRESADPVVGED